jgi:hypothetical protein
MNSEITWYNDGTLHRAVVLPELPRSGPTRLVPADGLPPGGSVPLPAIQFQFQAEESWVPYDPDPASASFASAAARSEGGEWNGFLSLLPAPFRRFLGLFKYERLEALSVLIRCPGLLPELESVPALTVFLAAHGPLRGTGGPRWDEINAVYEHGGIFALLEWLGLPACRQTLSILSRVADPEIPQSLLAPVRAALWEPETLCQLGHVDSISEKDLARFRHPLAA